ncbi:MAG: rhodanese-like domain-containing protein [Sphingobacteriia bacterium]|nr:MAG: rhodanese-like domain-containing protein [Sphingobacteriia bacterium]
MMSITPIELKLLLSDPAIFLVDVREQHEHDEYNIGGLLIPLGEIVSRIHEIPTDQKVVLYCKRGIRSMIAIQKLQLKNPELNLFNLSGGMEAWKTSC